MQRASHALRGDKSDEPERLAKSFRVEVVETPNREPRESRVEVVEAPKSEPRSLSDTEMDQLRRTLDRNRELIGEQLRGRTR